MGGVVLMPGGGGEGGAADRDAETIAFGRRVGLGCFAVFAGTWSGAMVGVLTGKAIAAVTRSPGCEGLPTCNWYVHAGTGALLGALSLPILVFWRLRRRGGLQSNSRG